MSRSLSYGKQEFPGIGALNGVDLTIWPGEVRSGWRERYGKSTGQTIKLADFKRKTFVRYFYPKNDTPG